MRWSMQSDNNKNGVSTQTHLREMKNAGPLRPYPRYPVTAFHLEIKADSEGMREQRRKEGMVDELGVCEGQRDSALMWNGPGWTVI